MSHDYKTFALNYTIKRNLIPSTKLEEAKNVWEKIDNLRNVLMKTGKNINELKEYNKDRLQSTYGLYI